MKKRVTAIMLLASSSAALAFNSPLFFPAGDIRVGTPATLFSPLSPRYTGAAHYFFDGTEGGLKFSCTLKGNGPDNQVIIAQVFPTKNFNVKNPIAVLTGGNTIERTWYLSDEQETNGNVNIRLDVDTTGDGATVQCQGTAIA